MLDEMAEALEQKIRSRIVDRVLVELEPPTFSGSRPPPASGSDLRNAISFALSEARDFGFVATKPSSSATDYRVKSDVVITSARRQKEVAIRFSIEHVASRQTFKLPEIKNPVTDPNDIGPVYFEAARSLVNALQELRSRQDAQLPDPVADDRGAGLGTGTIAALRR